MMNLWMVFHGDFCEGDGFDWLKIGGTMITPYNPWDWYIYLRLPQESTIHVAKYTSPMDCMGTKNW